MRSVVRNRASIVLSVNRSVPPRRCPIFGVGDPPMEVLITAQH